MKKVFCDVCGDEMTYEEIPDHLKGGDVEVNVLGRESKTLTFKVNVNVTPVYKGIFGTKNPIPRTDICNDCRLHLLDRLDTRPKAL